MNLTFLSPFEVRHFIQPPALKKGDPVALLNEYLVIELEKAIVKNPVEMREHLVTLHRALNDKPEVH